MRVACVADCCLLKDSLRVSVLDMAKKPLSLSQATCGVKSMAVSTVVF